VRFPFGHGAARGGKERVAAHHVHPPFFDGPAGGVRNNTRNALRRLSTRERADALTPSI
jgi:hypothetical protein